MAKPGVWRCRKCDETFAIFTGDGHVWVKAAADSYRKDARQSRVVRPQCSRVNRHCYSNGGR